MTPAQLVKFDRDLRAMFDSIGNTAASPQAAICKDFNNAMCSRHRNCPRKHIWSEHYITLMKKVIDANPSQNAANPAQANAMPKVQQAAQQQSLPQKKQVLPPKHFTNNINWKYDLDKAKFESNKLSHEANPSVFNAPAASNATMQARTIKPGEVIALPYAPPPQKHLPVDENDFKVETVV